MTGDNEQCVYTDCDNTAEFLDIMGDPICQECMEREIKDGVADFEDFLEL